jgi:hypothetical protein
MHDKLDFHVPEIKTESQLMLVLAKMFPNGQFLLAEQDGELVILTGMAIGKSGILSPIDPDQLKD